MPSEVTRRRFIGSTGTAALLGAGTAIAAGPGAAQAAGPARPIKILGICCSLRKGKTTAAALGICLEAVKAADARIEVELIELAGLKIPAQPAAGIDVAPGERDDFPGLVPKLSEPALAGIILGTPVYFGNMSSLCKAFLERCIVFHKSKLLANKVGGVLAVGGGRNGGQELTIRSVQVALMSQQMIVVGDAPPTGRPRRGRRGHGQKPRPPRGGDRLAAASVRVSPRPDKGSHVSVYSVKSSRHTPCAVR
jgi:multimeric flavodoxin WrbA